MAKRDWHWENGTLKPPAEDPASLTRRRERVSRGTNVGPSTHRRGGGDEGALLHSAARAELDASPHARLWRSGQQPASPVLWRYPPETLTPFEGDLGLPGLRPIYIIAHRCNSSGEIRPSLDAGATGIECDLVYGKKGGLGGAGAKMWWVSHGPAVGPGAEPVSDWLKVAEECARDYRLRFSLLYFDIKTPDGPLKELREMTRDRLPPGLTVLYSVSSLAKAKAYFYQIHHTLSYDEGLNIDEENDPAAVHDYFRNGSKVVNYWYSNGINTVDADPDNTVAESVWKACGLRDQFTALWNYGIKKTCVWTLANPSSIEFYINTVGVDAVMVSQGEVGTAAKVVAGTGITRPAQRYDAAFSRFAGNAGWNGQALITDYFKGFPEDFLPLDAATFWPIEGEQDIGRAANGLFFKGAEVLLYTPGRGVWLRSNIKNSFFSWPDKFWPIDAAIFFPSRGKGYFFKGDFYIRYTPYEGVDFRPRRIVDHWPGWPNGFWPVKAPLFRHNGRVFFFGRGTNKWNAFRDRRYLRYDTDPYNAGVDKGPVLVADNWYDWPNAPDDFLPLDAAIAWPDGKVYFFQGERAFRYVER